MSQNKTTLSATILFIVMLVGAIFASKTINDSLKEAMNIQSPDVWVDEDDSERLRQQMTALFPPKSVSDTLRGATILLLRESNTHPFLLAESGGMVHCADPSLKHYVVTVPSDIPSFEVSFDMSGNVSARVPKQFTDPVFNDAFPVLQQSFKLLSQSCEMKAAFDAEFGEQTYPLHSGLSDVVFSSDRLIHRHVRASFDLTGKVTKLSSHYGTLEGKSATESARLLHDLINNGI